MIVLGASFSSTASVAVLHMRDPFQPGVCLKDSALSCPLLWLAFISLFIGQKTVSPVSLGGVRSTCGHLGTPLRSPNRPLQEHTGLFQGNSPYRLAGADSAAGIPVLAGGVNKGT